MQRQAESTVGGAPSGEFMPHFTASPPESGFMPPIAAQAPANAVNAQNRQTASPPTQSTGAPNPLLNLLNSLGGQNGASPPVQNNFRSPQNGFASPQGSGNPGAPPNQGFNGAAGSQQPNEASSNGRRTARAPRYRASGNILSSLFGMNRPGAMPNRGFNNGFNPNRQGTSPQNPRGGGLLELLKRHGLGDGAKGIGDSVMDTISSVSQPIGDLLDSFGIDGEKLVILLVMWAIFSEHEDNYALLLALGYILL